MCKLSHPVIRRQTISRHFPRQDADKFEASPPASSSPVASPVASRDSASPNMKNVVRRKLTGYVGFANLPNQWHRKSVRKGFNFNVMVVGKLDGR